MFDRKRQAGKTSSLKEYQVAYVLRKVENMKHTDKEKIVRTISGWATAIFFFLILGKAGASDCGAPWEEIFPSTFIYCGLMILSFHIWEAAGGNCISK